MPECFAELFGIQSEITTVHSGDHRTFQALPYKWIGKGR
jgi:hypothetical protein